MARSFCLVAILLLSVRSGMAGPPVYCAVSLVGPEDPYHQVAERLVEIRHATVVHGTPDTLDSLLPELKRIAPEHVAIVLRPDQFDVNLAHRVMKLATRVDDDPFLDFSYGFLTGRTADAATRLAEAGVKAEQKRQEPSLALAGVAGGDYLKQSTRSKQILPLKGLLLSMDWSQIVLPEANGGKRDTEFIDTALTRLESEPLIAFAGHGYPDRVVGGPNWQDVKGRDFTGAVAFNIACYTGVTSTWFENDWKSRKLARRTVDPGRSFCLQMIDTGVAGYVAYSCPRPAGPEMFGDMVSVATQGISIGEQRRRQGNSVILTHLAQGFDEVVAESLKGDTPLKPAPDVDEIVRGMSTGGVLFGDPAFVPFDETPGAWPVVTEVTRGTDQITARVSVNGTTWQWQCGDQLEQPKLRLEARIPLGSDHVRSVRMTDFPFGDDRKPLRLSGAVERHGGQRFVHVKASFERPEPAELITLRTGISGTFVIETTSDPDQAKRRFSVASVQAAATGDRTGD